MTVLEGFGPHCSLAPSDSRLVLLRHKKRDARHAGSDFTWMSETFCNIAEWTDGLRLAEKICGKVLQRILASGHQERQ